MKAGNQSYGGPGDLPDAIPVFPLPGALLLPRAEMPLNIFEPRYLAMVDQAMCSDRVIGMIQPGNGRHATDDGASLCHVGCAGRITSLAETGDDRYLITLSGIARFALVDEIEGDWSFRMCRISTADYAGDFDPVDEKSVDRRIVMKTFRDYLSANDLQADWESVERASNENLVNTLAMMAPFGPMEKQALLEAPDLRARAETLVAITELQLSRDGRADTPLQ
jgi:Lon protease-like protein